MLKKLFVEAILKFLLGIILVGLLIFIPAGTLFFTNGWLFMSILFIPMFIVGIILIIKNPELLRKRLNVKEHHREQKVVVFISALIFICGFIVAGLNFRFGWYTLPNSVSICAIVVFVVAYLLYGRVLWENDFLSRTIEIQENQKVIDTGLYSIVRHPMYSATLILFLSMPIILGSIYSFFVFLLYPFIIVIRIKNEEMLLENELEGYQEYQKKVKYRLIPLIW